MKVGYSPNGSGGFYLTVEQSGTTMPAGWRLQKDGKFPMSKFWADSKEEIESMKKDLQGYLDSESNNSHRGEKLKSNDLDAMKSIFGGVFK